MLYYVVIAAIVFAGRGFMKQKERKKIGGKWIPEWKVKKNYEVGTFEITVQYYKCNTGMLKTKPPINLNYPYNNQIKHPVLVFKSNTEKKKI